MHSHQAENRHSAHRAQGQRKAIVAERGYDADEIHILHLARIFFVAFSQPDSQFWFKGYGYGEHIYGTPTGSTIAQATVTMLNEMRCIRPHTFNYTDPRCEDCGAFMTPEERYLIDSFKNLRAGKNTQARLNAMMLCEGKNPELFLSAAERLAEALGAVTH